MWCELISGGGPLVDGVMWHVGSTYYTGYSTYLLHMSADLNQGTLWPAYCRGKDSCMSVDDGMLGVMFKQCEASAGSSQFIIRQSSTGERVV